MSCRKLLLLISLLLLTTIAVQAESTELLPAGMLLTCTMDEPNLSSKTAQAGDPVLCHLSTTMAFGHQMFPRGSYLTGRLEDYKDPGHFYGKGWLEIHFDRLVLPGQAVLPLSAKIISVPHYRTDKEGKIRGQGHATRDTVEWMIPPLWPVKVLTLPGRGPYPTLKSEQRITLRLMEDEVIPPQNSVNSVPMPPWAHPSNSALNWPAPRNDYHLVNATTTHSVPRPPLVTSEPSGQTTTVLVLKDQSAYIVREYWLDGEAIHCVTVAGEKQLVPVGRLDLGETVRLNRERNVTFALQTRGETGDRQ